MNILGLALLGEHLGLADGAVLVRVKPAEGRACPKLRLGRPRSGHGVLRRPATHVNWSL